MLEPHVMAVGIKTNFPHMHHSEHNFHTPARWKSGPDSEWHVPEVEEIKEEEKGKGEKKDG